jgi:radical SAM protein with 4Fe4S-binding SPASM domain
MTNLILTRVCNQKCTFCFTNFLTQPQREAFVSLERFHEMIAFLDRSNSTQVRFLGGEPTIHPRFPELLDSAAKSDKKIVIFSNGLIPEKSLEAIENYSAKELIVLINANVFSDNSGNKGIIAKIRNVLTRLKGKCQLGYTIFKSNFSIISLMELIDEFDLIKSIRLGVAQPTSWDNKYLPVRCYPFIGQKIASFAETLKEKDIIIELDCGFVRCMFSDKEMDTLAKFEVKFGWHCSPIIDIDLDGSALACFPLSQEMRVKDATSLSQSEVLYEFNKKFQIIRGIGIYPECQNCIYLENQICSGGCLSMVLKRFHKT